MRDRVDAFGVSEPELNRTGKDQIEVNLPGVDNAQRAADQVGSTAQLFFYDWEKNVLDENCKTERDRDQRRPAAASPASTTRSSARAEVRDRACRKNSQAAAGPRFYAFDKVSKKPFNNGLPDESREASLEGLSDAEKARAEVLEVKPGVLVLRDEKGSAKAPPPDRFWIVRDYPGLSGTDIKNPEQNFDQRAGNEPIVTFDFSDKGQKAFQKITSEVAQRGADNANPLNPDPAAELTPLRDRARQRARLDPVHQLPREPRRHRRLDRRADLRRLHDHERAGPGEGAQDRRPAAEARPDLALAGLGHAGQAGAQPGPQGAASPAS